MADNKVVFKANAISFPPLMRDLGDFPSPNPNNTSQHGSAIKKPGIEMESIVNKLITHLKEK